MADNKEFLVSLPHRKFASTQLYRGIMLDIPLIELIEAYESPSRLSSLFSDRLIEGKKHWIRRGRNTGTSWSGSRSVAEMFAWDSAGPGQSPSGVGNFSGKIYVGWLYKRGRPSPPSIHIPVVLVGRPELGRTNTDTAWEHANSQDRNRWSKIEDEYRLESGASIALEGTIVALPSKDRLVWALKEFENHGPFFSVSDKSDGKTSWVRLNTPLRLTAASWRGLVSHDIWNDSPAVILVDKLGRRNSYEVYVNGRQVSREWLLDDAKRKAEGELGYPVKWRRSKTAEVKALHYYFGWTTEFTDPSLAYFGEPA